MLEYGGCPYFFDIHQKIIVYPPPRLSYDSLIEMFMVCNDLVKMQKLGRKMPNLFERYKLIDDL